MVRYSSEHKQATRQRIIERAGRRFKREGIDRAGISALMSDAALTNGAFYNHFDSKEELVCAVLADQLQRQREAYGAAPFTREGFEQFARAYLSPEHRTDHEEGCPSAALLDDVIRGGTPARHRYTTGMLAIIDDIAAFIPAEDARARAASIFAAMTGTLQLSRAIDDPELAATMLDHGLSGVLVLIRLHCVAADSTRI
ncbi:TetR/AcrR family transcriptional regulator [Microbacterium karelineae]|uniref:TetR/AcrR family transcriptional regulator n=1 Tax=Microbacterium karelineae TaxID=2654283 RepID=UPI0012E9CE5E|nr:TetR/AcrR family transcriptional regulator [Microbacterium karelineae]